MLQNANFKSMPRDPKSALTFSVEFVLWKYYENSP